MPASRFHCAARDGTITLLLLLLAVLLSSTVFGVSGSPSYSPAATASASATSSFAAAPNKSDSDSIIPVPGNGSGDGVDGQARVFGTDSTTSLTSPTAVATFLARQAGAALARYFGTAGESEVGESRTFFIRRLQKKLFLGLIPVAFKAGILSVVIFTILLVAIKSLLIGKLLLVINLGYILAKLLAWKTSGGGEHHEHFKSWSAPPPAAAANDIHLHIHNAAPAIYPVATSAGSHDLPYGAHVPQLQQRGPIIHIEPSPAAPVSSNYGSYSPPAYADSWSSGGYQRREQTGNEYAYVDQQVPTASNYAAHNPTYIPNARFTL